MLNKQHENFQQKFSTFDQDRIVRMLSMAFISVIITIRIFIGKLLQNVRQT